MRSFNKITIIGVGLIGGSIGLATKKRKLAREVVGVFRRAQTAKRALRCKAVDKATLDIREGVKGADLIIIASPVHSIPALARLAVKFASKGAIITDAGSTKGWIVSDVEKMVGKSKRVSFVGSHPMAGSENTGVEFARADLLESSPCIVTKTVRTDKAALAKVINFWKSLGARVEVMDPASHDRSVALISHLPHIVAFSLAGCVPEKAMKYAAEGFKDTTRVASSDADLWADIFFSNKKEVLRSAGIFSDFYKRLVGKLSKNDRSGVRKCLTAIKAKRDRWAHGKKR
jgi:prephenate dehydrogenase